MRFHALSLVFLCTFLPSLVLATSFASDKPTPTLEERATSVLPFDINNPGATPIFVVPAVPSVLPVAQIVQFIHAVITPPTSVLVTTAVGLVQSIQSGSTSSLITVVKNLLPNLLCSIFSCPTASTSSIVGAIMGPDCLDSTSNDTVINSLFKYGGAGTTVFLCQNASIVLQDAIQFTASYQTLTTKPNTGDLSPMLSAMRAKITVGGQNLDTAIYGNCVGCSYLTVTNIIVDGNRPNLGWLQAGNALIEMGGTNNNGHLVNSISAYEPRGWSTLHMIEGQSLSCSNSTVTNNQLGPAGHAPTANQRRLRRDTGGPYPAGQWADGASIACKGSTVTGNTITDATDGAIVIFGAVGTKVTNNQIIAQDRQLLGGINAVDYAPNYGDYTNTVVSGNTITAAGSMIKIGIAVGYMSWTSPNDTSKFTTAGTFTGNTFKTSGTGYFGFSITASGANKPTITGNSVVAASYGGSNTSCFAGLPAFGPFIRNPYTTKGMVAQSSFVNGPFSFAICTNPGPITSSGVSVAGN